MKIREQLKGLVADDGRPMYKIEAAAGVSPGTLYRFLSGATDNITLKTLQKCADALGKDLTVSAKKTPPGGGA